MVKRMIAMLMILSVAFACVLAGCGTKKEETVSNGQNASAKTESDTDSLAYAHESAKHTEESTEVSEVKAGEANILIAYFTWADNTEVENPDAVDVDASTSASVLPPGNAAMLAGWIQDEFGGYLFSIHVTEPYSSDYDECLDRAADEKAEDARPPLKSRVENMDSYDIVFLGFPNWWYTVPMAVHSFVEEYDWSGKMVIPFVTHGTGGLASCIDDLEEALAPATIMEPIGVYRDDIKSAQPEIQEWIAGLNIDFRQKGGREMAEKNDKKIRIVLDGGEIVVKMENNPAAEDLLGRLPLTMKFEDFNGTEKIHYLESSLDTAGAPDECTPKAGDLAYYAPWGNLAFFYQDFRNSPQLVPLGSIESGAQYLEQLDEYAEVTMELVP